jgi:hypothetical protein
MPSHCTLAQCEQGIINKYTLNQKVAVISSTLSLFALMQDEYANIITLFIHPLSMIFSIGQMHQSVEISVPKYPEDSGALVMGCLKNTNAKLL